MVQAQDWYKVVDVYTNNVIASGKVVEYKSFPFWCISFDKIHYFSLKESTTYRVEKTSSRSVVDNINQYKALIVSWMDAEKHGPSAIFKENNFDSLDQEIKEAVMLINRIPNIRTLGSCCGHGYQEAYIDCAFTTFQSIKFVVDLIEDNCLDFVLTTQPNLRNYESEDEIFMRIESLADDERCSKDLEQFTACLRNRVNEYLPHTR